MAVYYGLVAFVFILYVAGLFAVAAGARKSRVTRDNNVLIALAVFSVFALRSTSVGVDVQNYIERFNMGRAIETRKMDLEIGYAALNDGIRLLTSDSHIFLAVVAVLTIAPVAWTIGKTSESVYLSWILFITVGPFAFMLSGLRQGIALAAVFATLPFLMQRKVVVPLLLVVVAVTFHASALVFLPAVYFYRVRLTLRTILATVTALIITTFFGEWLVGVAIESLYESYDVVATGAYRWALVNAGLWLAFTVLYRAVCERLPRSIGLYTLVLVGVVLLSLTAFGTNVGRGATYYLQFFAILAPNALSVIADRRLGTWLAGLLSLMTLTYFFLTAGQTAYEIVPYQFKWEG